jgi:hypothetical protein
MSAGRNRLPAGIALRHIRVIARRIGAVIPDLGGVGLAVVIIAIVWRVIPPIGICEPSTEEKPVIAKSIAAEPAIVKSIPVEPAPVEPAPVKPAPVKPAPVKPAKSGVESATVEAAKSAAVEAAKSAAVETSASAPAMRPGIGGIWLAERGSAQESSGGCQNPGHPGPGSRFV